MSNWNLSSGITQIHKDLTLAGSNPNLPWALSESEIDKVKSYQTSLGDFVGLSRKKHLLEHYRIMALGLFKSKQNKDISPQFATIHATYRSLLAHFYAACPDLETVVAEFLAQRKLLQESHALTSQKSLRL